MANGLQVKESKLGPHMNALSELLCHTVKNRGDMGRVHKTLWSESHVKGQADAARSAYHFTRRLGKKLSRHIGVCPSTDHGIHHERL